MTETTPMAMIGELRKVLKSSPLELSWSCCHCQARLNATEPLVKIIGDLEHGGVTFESLGEKIDTGSASGKLQFHVFAALAEFERNLRFCRDKVEGIKGIAFAFGNQNARL